MPNTVGVTTTAAGQVEAQYCDKTSYRPLTDAQHFRGRDETLGHPTLAHSPSLQYVLENALANLCVKSFAAKKSGARTKLSRSVRNA
jgi:hypothetical protein